MARNYHRRGHSHEMDMDPKELSHRESKCCHCGSLTCIGGLWAILSFLTMGLATVGFYMPFWIEGTLQDRPAYMGTFRRCNYPRMVDNRHVEIIAECGRYSEFDDIPTLWWQVVTVSVGIGCGLALLVAIVAMLSLCLRDVLSVTSVKVAGAMQFLAGICIGTGCLLYPFGWESYDVRQVCGEEAKIYGLGHCKVSWAYYATIGGAGSMFLCALMSCSAARRTPRVMYRPRNRVR